MNLQEKYSEAFKSLTALFGAHHVNEKTERLNEIFETCELAWYRNLNNLKGKTVKYLLIGEAAPWSEKGEPVSYFYETLDGKWVEKIINIFLQPSPSNQKECLEQLAHSQFLLIDSLPFPMVYCTNLRKRKDYLQLVKNSIDYMNKKIFNSNIN